VKYYNGMKGKRKNMGENENDRGPVGQMETVFYNTLVCRGIGAAQYFYIYNIFYVTLGS